MSRILWCVDSYQSDAAQLAFLLNLFLLECKMTFGFGMAGHSVL